MSVCLGNIFILKKRRTYYEGRGEQQPTLRLLSMDVWRGDAKEGGGEEEEELEGNRGGEGKLG